MKKIISLFKRRYDGDRQVYDEIVLGAEWVVAGEGVATEKFDGSACMVRDGKLYKRYDRKPSKRARKRHKKGEPWPADSFRPAPPSWEGCEPAPNLHTGHWPGWMSVGDGPEDKWHREAWEYLNTEGFVAPPNGTYELVGLKVQGNPYGLDWHTLWLHGSAQLGSIPTDYDGLCEYLAEAWGIEGIVWHHPDGRMVKIKRRDFGLPWPANMVADAS